MRKPTVIAYHLIWTAYGTWLPNDPRGSGSTSVLSDLLAELGKLHFGRRKIQPASRQVREFYKQAEPRLRFPAIRYDEANRGLIAAGIADAINEHRLRLCRDARPHAFAHPQTPPLGRGHDRTNPVSHPLAA
jgi:hypothetical protein